MFQIAVCDDEKIFVDQISEIVKAFFKEHKLECQVDEFYSGEEFVELKEEVGKYDIVFLDMQMDKMNGIETAKYLRKYGEDTFLVFVTAYAEYAATGYQVQATWFVIKDYDKMEADLREALKNILRKIRKDHKVIAYKFSNVGDAEIRVSNMIYIESKNHKSIFHVLHKGKLEEYSLYKKLDDIEKEIGSEDMLRIQKSYLVNVNYVEKLLDQDVVLIDGTTLHFPKYLRNEVRKNYLRKRGGFYWSIYRVFLSWLWRWYAFSCFRTPLCQQRKSIKADFTHCGF